MGEVFFMTKPISRGEELEYVLCNLCGADDTRLLVTESSWSIVKCRRCSLVYVNPRLTGESRTNYYVKRMRTTNGEASSQLPEADLIHAAKVREYHTRIDRQVQNSHVFALQRRILQQISEVVPTGRFLDVGCGWGYLLKFASEEFGYDVYGIEPTKEIAEACRSGRGLKNVSQGTIDEAEYPPDFFNVVTLMDVLEHLPDPGKTLAKINTMLVPGGAVFIKVPNMHYLQLVTLVLSKTHLAKRLPSVGEGLTMNPREHLYNFYPRALSELLSRHGFKPEKLLRFGALRNGISQRDQLKRAYSLLAWFAKTLSAGQVNLYPDMGILATKVG